MIGREAHAVHQHLAAVERAEVAGRRDRRGGSRRAACCRRDRSPTRCSRTARLHRPRSRWLIAMSGARDGAAPAPGLREGGRGRAAPPRPSASEGLQELAVIASALVRSSSRGTCSCGRGSEAWRRRRAHGCVGAGAEGGGRLADREPHRGDFLLLLDDDFLRDAAQLLVVAVAQLDHAPCRSPLVMRRHHLDEVAVDVAASA